MSKSIQIGIIGLGFVGLTFAVFLALKNFKIVGIDIDQNKTAKIKNGEIPFFEADLGASLKRALKKSPTFMNSVQNLGSVDIIFVTVGTPSKEDGGIDLKYIKSVSEQLSVWLKEVKHFPVIAIKSTVIPGTLENVIKPILEKSGKSAGIDFGLVSNPEFLKEGSALHDTINPHVVVIGGDKKSAAKLEDFYKKVYPKGVPIKITNPSTAEFIKYANNAFLATKISYINTIAKICQNIPGTNVDDIAEVIGIDPRISPQFLRAGPGYGGSCFPKDVQALISLSNMLGVEPLLLEATHKTNLLQADAVLDLVKRNVSDLSKSTVSILGLSFKENSDDIRESVSISLIRKLLSENASIKVHDPMAIENMKYVFGNKITYCYKVDDCLKDSDCAIILTAWEEYKRLSSGNFKKMRNALLIDTRRIFAKKKLDIKYIALGIGG